MTAFQERAVVAIAVWILVVVVRFRKSRVVLIGGLFAVAAYTVLGFIGHDVSMKQLGLATSASRLSTVTFALVWLALMLAYSPLADRIATRFVAKPPTLGAFRALQQSKLKLVIGIVIAWILGGFLEELVFRGIVLQAVESAASAVAAAPIATALGVVVAAIGAGLLHLYQGPRAAIIITQLSILFGVLFVVSGYNLWAVILCHGFYDTVAFIRFATKKSSYSNLEAGTRQTA